MLRIIPGMPSTVRLAACGAYAWLTAPLAAKPSAENAVPEIPEKVTGAPPLVICSWNVVVPLPTRDAMGLPAAVLIAVAISDSDMPVVTVTALPPFTAKEPERLSAALSELSTVVPVNVPLLSTPRFCSTDPLVSEKFNCVSVSAPEMTNTEWEESTETIDADAPDDPLPPLIAAAISVSDIELVTVMDVAVLPVSPMVKVPAWPRATVLPNACVALISTSAVANWLTTTVWVPVAVPFVTDAFRMELALTALSDEERPATRFWKTLLPDNASLVRLADAF